MKEHWYIVPINDGCSVLAFDAGFYLVRKEDSSKNEDVLIFSSKDEAQECINNCFAPQSYKPEQFWILGENINVQ
jgi:hypothetical protein